MTIDLTPADCHDLHFAITMAQMVVINCDDYSNKPEKLAEYLQNLDIIKEKLKS